VAVPETVEPEAGDVIETVGGVLSVPLVTFTTTAALVVVMPAVLRATAVRVWDPAATAAVFQETLYGAAVS
jgi:hypothetical protein